MFVWWGSLCTDLPLPLAYLGPTDSRLPVRVPLLISLDTRMHRTRTWPRMQSLGPFMFRKPFHTSHHLGAPSPGQSVVAGSCKRWHMVRIHHACVAAPCW